jgi:hypothetical protein
MAEFPRPPSAAIGNCIMADYRAYLLGSDGHFFDAVSLICETDNEAIEKAKHLVDGHDVELWQVDRKVAEFKHNQ